MHPILEQLTAQLRADTRELEACWANLMDALNANDNELAKMHLQSYRAALASLTENAGALSDEMEVNI